MKQPKTTDPGTVEVEKYLAKVPEPVRKSLNRIREAIRAAAPPDATEAISYGAPAFRYKGALVAYAAYADHCSFFPMSVAVMAAFKDDLEKYETSKGTIHFPVNRPLPATLVKKLVKARIAEKEAAKKKL